MTTLTPDATSLAPQTPDLPAYGSSRGKSTSSGEPSVLGAVLLVFLTLLIAQGYQCWGIAQQRKQLEAVESSLNSLLPQYDLIDRKLSFVSEDLLNLAPTIPGADRIVKEFSIRQNSPPASPEDKGSH